MSNVLANSYKATGMATAFSAGMSPERMADRSAAYAEKEAKDQELQNLRATKPTPQDHAVMAETQSVQLQNALEVQKQMLLENNKRTTFGAYERFDADGDVRHINTMLGDLTKSGSKIYGNISRVDKLVEEDRKMLETMGFSPDMVNAMLTNPDLNKSYVRITQKDGTTSFGDLDVLKGMTGYNDYADTKELTRQQTAREIEMLSTLGYDLSPDGREAFRRTKAELGTDVDPKSPQFQEAYTRNYDSLNRQNIRNNNYNSNGRGEKLTEKEAEAARRTRLDGITEDSPDWDATFSKHMSAINTEFGRPSAVRNIEGAEQAATELEAEGFWELDVNDLSPSERGRWETKIRRIEKLGGAELSVADRTNLARIQKLTSYGEAAGELTPEQVGIVDGIFRRVKKYISNDPKGVAAESAYNAFRNLVTNDLYGATLPASEAARFVSQFGSTLQQHAPVLVQLKTAMQEVQDSYQAITRMNDPMVLAWRTGKTEEELMAVMENLGDRIEMLDNIAKGKPITTVTGPVQSSKRVELTPEREAGLDKIFKGGKQ